MRGMWICIAFMGTFVHLAFSWIFALWGFLVLVFFFLFWFHPFTPNPTTWYGSHCRISLPPQRIRPSNICRHLSLPPLLSHLSAKLDVFSSSNLSLRVSPSSTHNSFLLALLWILSSLPALKTPQIRKFLMWAGTNKTKINFLKREGFFWLQATGNRSEWVELGIPAASSRWVSGIQKSCPLFYSCELLYSPPLKTVTKDIS